MKRLIRACAAIVAITLSTLIALGIAEIGIRAAYLPNPYLWQNFATRPINQQVTNLAIDYDPLLGYIAKPDLRSGPSNTHGKMGVRLHESLKPGVPSPPIPVGGILASGDSFTFGSDVADDQSWPAQMERMIGIPVVNAGAGGYGVDQAELRAEQLLDITKPRAIIVSFIPNNMGRNEFSVNGGLPKPYFEVVNGRLVLRNVPVPHYVPPVSHVGLFRATFGYSYALFWASERLGLRDIFVAHTFETRKVTDQGIEVACLLWKRLADKVADPKVRLVALAQYAGIQVSGQDNSRDHFQVEHVLDCAKQAGYIVVDSYPELRRRFETDPVDFWNNWVKQPSDKEWHTGHMSPEGNRLTAELIIERLQAEAPEVLQP